ncbi:MAG: hypothetical protein JWP52_2133 [Rhizobacter sp.]|nr:hypothetical protein [Rhizobacter sp.]
MNVPSTSAANAASSATQHTHLRGDSLPAGGSLFAQMLARTGAASPQTAAPALPSVNAPAPAPGATSQAQAAPAPAPANQPAKPEVNKQRHAETKRASAHPAEAKAATDRRNATTQMAQRQAAEKRVADQREAARSQDADTNEALASNDESVDESTGDQTTGDTAPSRAADDKSHDTDATGWVPLGTPEPLPPSERLAPEHQGHANANTDKGDAVKGLGAKVAADGKDAAAGAERAGLHAPGDKPEAMAAHGEELVERAPEFAKELHAAASAMDGIGNVGAAGHAAPSEAAASTSAAPADAPLPEFVMTTPADAPEFAQSLGVQVSVMARDGVGHAQLHLNPSEMGPIAVKIVMDGSQAQVDFTAASAHTRQIIEAGLPELAAALKDAGLTLSGGGVFDQSRHPARDGGGAGGHPASARSMNGLASDEPAVVRSKVAMSRGGVDLYA